MFDKDRIKRDLDDLVEMIKADPKFREDLYKGIDARITCNLEWSGDRYIVTRYEWHGGTLAGIGIDMMGEIDSSPAIGKRLDLPGLSIELVDYTTVGHFWYVKQV